MHLGYVQVGVAPLHGVLVYALLRVVVVGHLRHVARHVPICIYRIAFVYLVVYGCPGAWQQLAHGANAFHAVDVPVQPHAQIKHEPLGKGVRVAGFKQHHTVINPLVGSHGTRVCGAVAAEVSIQHCPYRVVVLQVGVIVEHGFSPVLFFLRVGNDSGQRPLGVCSAIGVVAVPAVGLHPQLMPLGHFRRKEEARRGRGVAAPRIGHGVGCGIGLWRVAHQGTLVVCRHLAPAKAKVENGGGLFRAVLGAQQAVVVSRFCFHAEGSRLLGKRIGKANVFSAGGAGSILP